MNNKDKEAINKKLEKILDDAVNLQIKNPEASADMFKNCVIPTTESWVYIQDEDSIEKKKKMAKRIYTPTKRYNLYKATYKLVETKSFYHIKEICDGIETHFGKFRKENITKERVEKIIERLNQLRNHDY